jgi:hypothetical protein
MSYDLHLHILSQNASRFLYLRKLDSNMLPNYIIWITILTIESAVSASVSGEEDSVLNLNNTLKRQKESLILDRWEPINSRAVRGNSWVRDTRLTSEWGDG